LLQVVSGDELGNLFQWSGCLDDKQGARVQDMSHFVNLGSPVRSLFLLGHRCLAYTGTSQFNPKSRMLYIDYGIIFGQSLKEKPRPLE